MPANESERSKKRDLIAIASVPLIMTLGNSMFIPVLPVIQGKLGLTQLQTSFIITAYAVTAILLIPPAMPTSSLASLSYILTNSCFGHRRIWYNRA